MALQEYSEEELLAKKYNELLKISKKYGIKTAKRLKTDKLIEAILKCQEEEAVLSLSQDAEAVVSALEGATHTSQDAGAAGSALEGPTHPPEEDELLLDIQFPECGPKDFLECNSDSATDISVEAVTGKQEQQGHKRSGTYEVEETEETQEESGDNEEKKMKRSSTFDYTTSNEVTLPIDEKQTEENSKQMSTLTDKITLRGTRRNRVLRQPSLAHRTSNTQTKGGGGKAATKEGLSVSSKRRRSQSEPETKEALPSSPWQSRLSISSSAKRQRQSITMTPPAPAPALRPSLQQRRSRGTPAALTTTTTTTATTTATIAKPVFTIGCGDKKEGTEGAQGHRSGTQDKGTTGIPRFMSYARRLKVPNFARIHEQAFQRMDSLDDYVKKKRARQDTLSSTTKKKQEKAKVFQPSITTVKNLNFDFTESPLESEKEGETSQTVTANKGTNNHSQGPDTVTRSVKKATNTPAGARLSRRVTTNAVKPPNAIPSVKKEPTRKSPRLSRKPSPKSTNKASPKQTLKPSLKTVPEGQKVSPKNTNKTSPKTDLLPTTGQKAGHKVKVSPKPKSVKKVSAVTFPVFGSHLKENYNPGKLQGSSPTASKLPVPSAIASPASVRKRMQDYSKGLAAAGPSYVPYKGAVKPLKTRDNLKNLAQRKHNVKTSKQIREGQKNILKGVRLNKRFELQMANRGITL